MIGCLIRHINFICNQMSADAAQSKTKSYVKSIQCPSPGSQLPPIQFPVRLTQPFLVINWVNNTTFFYIGLGLHLKITGRHKQMPQHVLDCQEILDARSTLLLLRSTARLCHFMASSLQNAQSLFGGSAGRETCGRFF